MNKDKNRVNVEKLIKELQTYSLFKTISLEKLKIIVDKSLELKS